MCNFSRAFQEKKFTSIGVPSEKLCPIYGGPSEVGVDSGEIEMYTNRWMEFFQIGFVQMAADGRNKTEPIQI